MCEQDEQEPPGSILDKCGLDGWELVFVRIEKFEDMDYEVLYFKRQIDE
jgi:hypothetical protein